MDDFLSLHESERPLLMANPWDRGSAVLLASIGLKALATTSSGFAATLGRLDGQVTRDEAVAHAGDIAAAVDVPVSADLENCFAHDPAGVADTVRLAGDAGLAGCSVEDFAGREEDRIYEPEEAAERVAAAVEAARAGSGRFVLTARAENYVHNRFDLADTIDRLQRFQEAGADVLFAPGVRDLEEIRELVGSVDRPVNVLVLPGMPSPTQLADAGVSRISVGGAFAFAAYGAAAAAGRELLERGTYDYWETAASGAAATFEAFSGLSGLLGNQDSNLD